MSNHVYVIDGNRFSDFGGFIREFNLKVFGDAKTWSGNLDQLEDMLRGGYGTPTNNEAFTIRWLNSKKSRSDLGHAAMNELLRRIRSRVHPTNIEEWNMRIQLTAQNKGETLFLNLVDIFVANKSITLILE
jgi:RNAse (barnase) inhibitor barstar